MGPREGEDPAGESGEKSPQLPGEGQAQLEPHLRELLAVQARFDRDVQTWQRQARQVQALYGDFDLKKELADPTFRNLLKGGMGVQAAYEATHHRALLLSAMEHTARRVRDKTCRDIALRAARPQENAFAPGTLTRPDVYTMDKRQREDIERRVKQGERVML